MKIVSTKTMQALDRATIERGTPGEELMLRAGEGLADATRRLAEQHQLVDAPVLLIAGSGNNGGDAFVTAALLHDDGWPVECWLAAPEGKLKGDALIWFKKMKKAGVSLQIMPEQADWQEALAVGTDAEIIVDALLGTGAKGEPRGVIGDAVRFIDEQVDQALIVAVDLPSGLSLRADLTVTMGLPKQEHVAPENVNMVGNLDVVDIGLDPEAVDNAEFEETIAFLHPTDLKPLFSRRDRGAHKGTYGHLFCMGGSKGFSGAVTMACRSALRSGVGLVSALVPENIHGIVAASVPEAMIHASMPDGEWSAVLAGCGMGRAATTREQVLHLLEEAASPMVLDADAITVLSEHIEALASADCPRILTPHPGEFARLFGLKVDEVQEDRVGMARMAAHRLNAVIVLKGAGTVIAAPDGPSVINLTGNPGMASGGSGDILGGLLAGLLAQGMDPFEAACAAVWLHGRAGDLAAAAGSQATLIATDLIDKLPDAFRELSPR